MSYAYDRDFFEPAYLPQIPLHQTQSYDYYGSASLQSLPTQEPSRLTTIQTGEPIVPYGWRPDWTRPVTHSEWNPSAQTTLLTNSTLLPVPEPRTFGYIDTVITAPSVLPNSVIPNAVVEAKPQSSYKTRDSNVSKPFRCQVCGKSFSQAANLTAHKRVHTGEKPFTCSICNRPFSQSSSLVTHKRTHSGERPYPCGHCDKAFTDSSTLTKHLRTHTGQKPYSCPLCLMRFTQSGNLHRHMKTHKAN